MTNRNTNKNPAGWNFDNSYARLPEDFYARQNPVPVQAPQLAVFNRALAETLGLSPENLESPEGAAIFAGNALPEGADPIAQAYAGHQYGNFTMLGDGRALLLGEHLTPDGVRFDIQLKGSGRTPFSRGGDGRAALAPMLREYIISEAMHAFGIPTTRSLAVALTGESVTREVALPGAVLTRVAASHIRIGTFEFAAARLGLEGTRILADYTIERYYPALADADNSYLAFLNAATEKQASLMAQWLSVGFIHGVMNTDNMAVSGETIDYGPCAFVDIYDPATVFSSIDRHGRYAYGNQARIAQWNLARFAEALLPLLHTEESQAVALAEDAVNGFAATFEKHWMMRMRAKLGLTTQEPEDAKLIETLLVWMHASGADYTNTFRALDPETTTSHDKNFVDWHANWQARLNRQPDSDVRRAMACVNPAMIPRNHRVEQALNAATAGDFDPLQELLAVVITPYAEAPEKYRLPPTPEEKVCQTFCGT